ncbi:phage tail assembly chaperone [Chromobacterium sp. ATCC 53434]|uniref:phage tail assembly chaperone n=1 Tax=Chromobacterium sp. (strain ATCC 53434 / SC 14030) TaxID=2059672 RepID=UPI00130527FC|nr:phage tail assembly chaperone [Chromobacterium sp. ATCC 53434]
MDFSPSLCGFFDSASTIRPADAYEIPMDLYNAMLDAQASGAIISVDDTGAPIARAKPPATPEEMASDARAHRDLLLKDALNVLDRHAYQKSYELPTTLTEDQARQWAAYAQVLRDVPQQPEFPLKTTWPSKPQ